jgi:hypothetical protein
MISIFEPISVYQPIVECFIRLSIKPQKMMLSKVWFNKSSEVNEYLDEREDHENYKPKTFSLLKAKFIILKNFDSLFPFKVFWIHDRPLLYSIVILEADFFNLLILFCMDQVYHYYPLKYLKQNDLIYAKVS